MTTLDVRIDDVAVGGDGVGRVPDGRIAFVRGAVPGDRVTVTVLREKKRFIHAEVLEVLEAGPDRVTPPCAHAIAGCGGCGWQHLAPPAQTQAKIAMATMALERIGRQTVAPGTITAASGLPTERFRTTVRVVLTPDGPSFRRPGSHELQPVDDCLVAHPILASLLHADILGTDGEVTLRVGVASGERIARYEGVTPPDLALPDDVVLATKADPGDACIHEVIAGRRFRISARSFFQTSAVGAEALVAAVAAAGDGYWGSGALIDAYGGVGLFAGTLGTGMAVTVVESNKSSVADARHNLGDEAEVVRVPVERWRPTPADLVIADPPRAGLGAAGIDALCATEPRRLIAVHCDAASFGRDAGLLAERGFVRVESTLIDLFPHTPHLEIVSRFDRSDSPS